MAEVNGAVVWFTGVPASGKSTIARLVRDEMSARGVRTLFLDGDDLRKVMTPNPTYSEEERDALYATLGYVAALGAEGGSVSLVAATANQRAHRDRARARGGAFVEVFLKCDRTVLERRDPKGLYALARAGKIRNLPGYDLIYEEPAAPELSFDTAVSEAEEIAGAVVRFLEQRGLVPAWKRDRR